MRAVGEVVETAEDYGAVGLRLLMQSLERVLASIGEGSVAASLPWQSLWNPQASPPATELPATCAEDCLQAFSIAFQLLNVAEENAVAQARRQSARQDTKASESGSWEHALVQALERGASPAALAQVLSELRIEPVLTAHPTEAKRQTVLEHQRTLYRLLVARENSMWTSAERLELDRATDACLERLWRTGEIYLEKPELADERRLVMHFLGAVFPEAVAAFEARLHQAWAAVGLEPGLLARGGALPRVVFRSWVGGDRDGHPGAASRAARRHQRTRRGARRGRWRCPRVAGGGSGSGRRDPPCRRRHHAAVDTAAQLWVSSGAPRCAPEQRGPRAPARSRPPPSTALAGATRRRCRR